MKMLFKQKIVVIFLAHNYCILFWSQIAGADKVGYTNHPKINEFKNNVSQGSPPPPPPPPPPLTTPVLFLPDLLFT